MVEDDRRIGRLARNGTRVIYAGAQVLFYALAAAASPLVLAATFIVIGSDKPAGGASPS